MKKILIYLLPFFLLVSCADDLEDYNVDPVSPTEVPPATLFTGAVKNLTDVLTTPNVNINNYRFYVQYWTSTQYLDEPRYNMTSRLIPQNMWQTLYRDVLADLNESKRLVQADEITPAPVRNNQLAQIEIMEVYSWSVLVNTFGDVPYTEALDPDITLPAYDDAQTVYYDILERLDAALALIDPDAPGFQEGDILYTGEMERWWRFGNSLKLRLAMVIADVDPGRAQTLVQEAAPHVFRSNADNAAFPYMSSPPNNNPISANLNPLFTSRQDFVAANTLVDVMNELDDPRRQFYFTQVGGQYVGGEYGFPNTYANFSTANPAIIDPTFEALLLDYSQIQFLLAEAVERGFIAGDAEAYYNNAITASILYWGGTEADAQAYLSQPEVNYTTAPGDWREKIGRQEWLALYNRGYEAWVEWRRLDAPNLLPPEVEGASTLTIPRRMIYPINEQTLNPGSREAAAQAIGGDESSTRLFWDVD